VSGRPGGRFLRLALGALLAGCAAVGGAAPTPRPDRSPGAACLDVATLPPDVRATAGHFALAAGDREGLYTLDGGLKPVSSDIAQFRWRVHPTVEPSAGDTLARWRRAVAALSCGEIDFAVQVFAAVHPGRGLDSVRTATVAVGHRAAIAETISRHAAFFIGIGVTTGLPLSDVLGLVDVAPRAARWRAYGLLFGYPAPAVDFFVAAGLRGDSTQRIEPRDFRRLPTWRKSAPAPGTTDSLSSFVYAVPAGAPWSPADPALARAVAPRYARYAAWRGAASRTGEDALAYWRSQLAALPPR
jgi:hypothetical protein